MSNCVSVDRLASAGTAACRDVGADVPSAAKFGGDNMPQTAKLDGGNIPSFAKHLHCANITGHADQRDQLRTVDLYKSYRKGAIEVPVLRGVSMSVRQGEFLAIVGQSGSGKSTLLHLLGTLDAPDRGEIHYAGRRIDNLPTKARDALRNRQFGMIFQFYHLLPELNTLENVLSPLMIAHGAWSYLRHRRRHRARAEELLKMVGLSHRLKHRPRELSGGEMQRAAIARALVAQPDLLLADEPTGNLDESTGQEIIRILRTLNQQRNLTIVMVTHDRAIADQADRIVRLANGKVEE
jgi:lipoprotein-releasing system ATP-binding protein